MTGHPVYAPHAPLAELRTAALLVVATLRLWLRSKAGCAQSRWRDGLWAAGLGANGLRAFEGLAGMIVAAASGERDVRPLRCSRLGGTEARLLELLRLAQEGQEEQALALLASWLAPSAARLAAPLAQDLADALGAQGLSLAGAAPCPAATANRGLLLVH